MSSFDTLGITPAEFMNAVTAQLQAAAPTGYAQSLPLAEAGQTSFTGIGEILNANQDFRNAWHKQAVNLIAQILLRENIIVNPLSEFEGGLIQNGAEIEEMIIDTASTFKFDPTKAETKLFERRAPELYSRIHQATRDVSNVRTLQDTLFTQIFHSEAELDRYIVQVTQSMLSGNEYEKYFETKKLISEAISKNLVRKIYMRTDSSTAPTSIDVQKAILQHSKLMIHPSRFYNFGRGTDGINIQAIRSELRMIVPVGTMVDLNVDFFANAFHLDAVQSGLAIKEVDFFPNVYTYNTDHVVTDDDLEKGYLNDFNWAKGDTVPAGTEATQNYYDNGGTTSGTPPVYTPPTDCTLTFDGSKVLAVILDRRALLINPVLPTTFSTLPNALGRYTQLILNDKEYFSFSPFMPAVALIDDVAPQGTGVQDVQVDGQSVVTDGGADI